MSSAFADADITEVTKSISKDKQTGIKIENSTLYSIMVKKNPMLHNNQYCRCKRSKQ